MMVMQTFSISGYFVHSSLDNVRLSNSEPLEISSHFLFQLVKAFFVAEYASAVAGTNQALEYGR